MLGTEGHCPGQIITIKVLKRAMQTQVSESEQIVSKARSGRPRAITPSENPHIKFNFLRDGKATQTHN